MNANSPFFSIVIPTRQRHDTLKWAIQSVINQSYNNFEIVISDNFSTSETFEVANSFVDDRIKYYRAPSSLSMADNWELGLSKATGDYVFILGDDDALMPDGLEIAAGLVAKYNYKIISWLRFFYAWDSSIVPWLRNQLGVNLQQIAEIRSSYKILEEFYQCRIAYEQLPMAYNAFIHKDIVAKVKSVYGRYFDTHCPDAFSGIVNAYFSDTYLYSYRALSITGTSGHSNGAAHLFSGLNNNKNSQSQISNDDKDIQSNFHIDLLTKEFVRVPSAPETGVADVQLKAKDIFFPNDENIKFSIYNYLNLLIANINRDSSSYDNIKDYVLGLCGKHNIESNILAQIPAKIENTDFGSFQGVAVDSHGRANHLRVNCAQAGIFNVADAAKLALAMLPHHSQLKIHEPPTLKFCNLNIKPKIAIDGVFFQLYSTGIARVWKSLLAEWANTEFGNQIVVLDRAGTAPKIEGIYYRQIPAYDYNNTDADRAMLQQVCDELEADLFISTYYTTPLETPSVFMGYDMIPEVLGADLNQPMWQEKRRAIEHASAYLTISEHTAKDLVEIYSNIDPNTVTVAHCGVQSVFKQASITNLAEFRYKYGIAKPYFVIGASGGYKNIELFLQAFDRLPSKSGFDIIVTGGHVLSQEDRQYTFGSNVHYLRLDDFELSLAYAGAIALVYPSKYEGFGLPIVEAMASGCPVITCPNASIPEVAGEAAIYVFDDDIDGMAEALCEVQKPQVRAALITAGLKQVKQFSWTKMADIVKSVLIEQTLTHLQLSEDNLIIFPDWSQDEEELGEEISRVCYNLAQSAEFDRPTLLIDTTNAEDIESVNMLVSGIAMNLMMGSDIDITEHLEIALTGNLAPIQWQALLPKLHGRIKLEQEDVNAIESSGANLISEIQLTETPSLSLV
jgi:glycosyltransferase involved in cell wall biosynthesis